MTTFSLANITKKSGGLSRYFPYFIPQLCFIWKCVKGCITVVKGISDLAPALPVTNQAPVLMGLIFPN